jgi:hypothetical protein
MEATARRDGCIPPALSAHPARDQPDWYADRFDLLFEIIGDVLRATPLGDDDETRNVAAHAL